MSAHEFGEITGGIANIAIAVAVLVFVLVTFLRWRDLRRDKEVGAPPIHRSDES